ncbi:hypothetical protein [Scytonema hofmannii]|nr:hypothetical protein [Scytonema hofmannii]
MTPHPGVHRHKLKEIQSGVEPMKLKPINQQVVVIVGASDQ